MNRYNSPKKPAPDLNTASSEYMAKVLGIKGVKPANPVIQPSKKRSLPAIKREADDDKGGTESKKPRKKKVKGEEQRLRRFREAPPKTFNDRLARVQTQRMFMLKRKRTVSADGTYEEEAFDVAGSTGNVYQVLISKQPTCSCPDARNGNQCKHFIYVLPFLPLNCIFQVLTPLQVMVNILKARLDLCYQLAFLSTELTEIFASAPITQQPKDGDESSLSTNTGGFRKPIEGDCPVCVMPFEEGEHLVWCKAACGQNIHRTCFDQWQRSKPGQQPKCVYCRIVWMVEEKNVKDVSMIAKTGEKNREGYVNVAGELGISEDRQVSDFQSSKVGVMDVYTDLFA